MDGAIGFANRVAMIRGAGEIGVGERNASVRTIAQDIAGRGISVQAEEEAGLWIDVGVPPAIQDYTGDVAPWVEAAGREHIRHLLTQRALVLCE